MSGLDFGEHDWKGALVWLSEILGGTAMGVEIAVTFTGLDPQPPNPREVATLVVKRLYTFVEIAAG